MTPTELELVKVNARIQALEAVVAMILTASTRSPDARASLLAAPDQIPETTRLLPMKGYSPEMADLLSAEVHEAAESLIQFLKDHLKNR